MSKLIFATILLAALSTIVAAQTPQPPSSNQTTRKEHKGHGYAFVAPGASFPDNDGTLHIGVGGEGLLHKGFGVGGEIGYQSFSRDFRGGFGIASASAQYHFLNASQSGKLVPFVSGGYSLLFRSDVLNAVHFGGGVNYWFKERVGLRFEVRDHVAPEIPAWHLVGFRFGVTFR